MSAPPPERPPWTLAAAAAISLLVSGLLLLATVAQILLFSFTQFWPVLFAEVALTVSGVVHLASGVLTYQADWRAASVGAVAAAGSTVLSASWGAYLLHGYAVVTPLPPICTLSSLLASLLCVLLAPRALRFARATAE